MPWKVKQENGRFCVFKEGTSKTLKCYTNEKQANDYVAALYANTKETLEHLENSVIENDPVIVGIAATNIPHLPLPAMSVVEIEGKEMIKVPFLRSGVFAHPQGKLVFNSKVFDKMLENHKAKKSWYGVSLNAKHKPEVSGALAWFDEERGGFISKESDPEYGDLLVAYGTPTNPRALEMIKNKEFVFASAEINPNHKNNMMARLSADELEMVSNEELDTLSLEVNMDEVTISLEEYNSLKENATKVTESEAKVVELEAKLVEAENKLSSLEKVEEEVIPEPLKIKLEQQANEIRRLKQSALASQVEAVISKAITYRDESGKGHSPILLEIARNAMLGNEVALNESAVIKLESSQPADIADYFRKVFIRLLEVIPGQVQLETKTEFEDKKPFEVGSPFSNEDLKNFWAEKL